MREIEKLETAELLQLKSQLTNEIARAHNLQLAKKIQLNSAYGSLSNEWFRWFDVRLAESITLSGQLSIRWIESKMNQYLNKLFKTHEIDYVIACDTDSMYISLDKLVQIVYNDQNPSKEEIVTFIDKVCKEKLDPYIDKSYDELARWMNAYAQKMKMKREIIADQCIWLGKKHYILNVWDSEGVRYHEPKLKMKGIEAVKSSTPEKCRSFIKDALSIFMNGTQDQLIKFIDEKRKEFKTFEFEDVAFPRSCNNIAEYRDNSSIYRKGTPIHVRASLMYNHMIKLKNLDDALPISDGEKIKFCYLRLPNPAKENVIACPSMLPRELGIHEYIDYDTQFDKSFLDFVRTVAGTIGWRIEDFATLEDFFNS